MTLEQTISRRGVLVAGGVAALTPMLSSAPASAKAALAEPVTAYHGVTGAVHQQRFNQLSAQGYRMIALSVYGFRFDPRYAAVWVKRAGPQWVAVHGIGPAAYQAKVNEYVAAGYVPVIVSASGPRANPVFAAVFEKASPGTWIAKHGLVDGPAASAGTLANINAWARDHNCIPRSLAIYGGVTDRTYAGVWLPNTTGTKWQAHPTGDATEYQTWFNAYGQVPLRPLSVDASDPLQYAAIFTDDSVGPWVARHNLTADQYQAEFNTQAAAGRYPIAVQGGGVGGFTRYAAVFAQRDKPIPRAWTQTNAIGAGYAGIHSVMRTFMQSRGVRAGVLAVRQNGALKLSAGYTWAEPGYAITRPDSLLRIASVSKAFTCAAIQRLVSTGRLGLDQRVYQLLGINSVALPGQVKDARIDTVTVRQCVAHTGGWVRRLSNFDPVFKTREIARALNRPSRASKWDVARYMYGEPLQYNPGDSATYDLDDRYSVGSPGTELEFAL